MHSIPFYRGGISAPRVGRGNMRDTDTLNAVKAPVSGIPADVTVQADTEFVCSGRSEIRNMKISGKATVTGDVTISGTLEIDDGGTLMIERSGTVSMTCGLYEETRLIVCRNGEICVSGRLDASLLARAQILNAGNIRAYEFGGTADIFYDIFVSVDGNDRSNGEAARHGSDTVATISDSGKNITSVNVEINGVMIDHDMYTYDRGYVMILGSVLNGNAGDVEIFVTTDSGTSVPADGPEHSGVQGTSQTADTMLAMVMCAAIIEDKLNGRY